MPALYVLQGPDRGRLYEADDDTVIIGRRSGQVQLTDQGTSRSHAEIRTRDGSWMLTDLHSSNGTYLNGQRVVSPIELKYGDQIKVGSTLLEFTTREGAGDAGHVDRHRGCSESDGSAAGGSSILSSLDALEESVILQPPETADAVAAWNIVYRVAETIGTSDTVDRFLSRVTDIIMDHMMVDRLVLLMRPSEQKDLIQQLTRHRMGRRGHAPDVVVSQTIVNHVLETKQGVLCANAMTDERFVENEMPDSIHELGLRSVLCVPVIVHHEIHGILHLDCSMSHHTYTQEQLRLAVAIGRLMGMAVENLRLQESRVQTERLAAAGETVAYLSHHIRNILQGMQGGVDVVELGLKHGSLENAGSGWSLVRRNLDRILHLAMNMLTFSKDRKPSIEKAQLQPIIEDVVALTKAKADEKSVSLLLDFEEMPPIGVDVTGFHQVINNIVLNAISAAPKRDGRVHITTAYQPQNGCVIISIEDNGPGIDPEARDRLFAPFQSSKGQGGTGLGLAAAKKIVDELHGEIEIVSAPGKGAVFRIMIPLDLDQRAEQAEPSLE